MILAFLSDIVIGESQGEYALVAGFKVCRSPEFTSRHHGPVSVYVQGGLSLPSCCAPHCMLSANTILVAYVASATFLGLTCDTACSFSITISSHQPGFTSQFTKACTSKPSLNLSFAQMQGP